MAKTYNHKALIRSALRRIWLWSPMRRDAIRRATIGKHIVCEKCEGKFLKNSKPKLYNVDHIIPASEPTSMIKSLDDFVERLMCPSIGLQILCDECHKAKTLKENKIRQKMK